MTGRVAIYVVALSLLAEAAVGDEQPTAITGQKVIETQSPSVSLVDGLSPNLGDVARAVLSSRMELTPLPRVSLSKGPLRRVNLRGGDRFDAELITWTKDTVSFRLNSDRSINIPLAAIESLTNPPGEVDVLFESFETGSAVESDPAIRSAIDQTQAAEGQRSLRLDSSTSEYVRRFPKPLAGARIEFLFRVSAADSSKRSGEWQLQWGEKEEPITVQVGAEHRISVAGPRKGLISSQSITLDDKWHSFVVLVTPETTRLIVDQAILAVGSTPDAIHGIRFRTNPDSPKNSLWIDALQVRQRRPAEEMNRWTEGDTILLATGDELLGKILSLDTEKVAVETFGQSQMLPWSRLSGVTWKLPAKPVQQISRPGRGMVSTIELQPYTDRPDLTPERWTGTVLRNDLSAIVIQHSFAGELTIPWSEIRRVDSLFYGYSYLIDARWFHLGNSIRSDFRRQLPDGTELTISFSLSEIPRGRPFLSLDVTELEAAGTNAPPGSPFLAQLRAGQLLTEGTINDQRIGSLNSQIRFKSPSTKPERIRLPIPSNALKVGENLLRLRQLPLKYPGNEFDDCEVGNFRLEFDQTHDH